MDKDVKRAVNQVIKDAGANPLKLWAREILALERLEDVLSEMYEFRN